MSKRRNKLNEKLIVCEKWECPKQNTRKTISEGRKQDTEEGQERVRVPIIFKKYINKKQDTFENNDD